MAEKHGRTQDLAEIRQQILRLLQMLHVMVISSVVVSGGSASEISESAKLLCGEYTVPDVIGLKEATASFRLLSEGFGNVKIEYAEDYTKTDGIVIGQNPEAGSYAVANEEIIITVCKNPALTVLFEGNSDEDIVTISTDNMIVYKGRTYGELPTAQRDYYYFDGWYTESEGGTKIEADTIVTATANHTLYAHWTLKDEWGSWSNWSDTKVTAGPHRQVETKKIAATYKTQYNYSRWMQYSDNTGWGGPWEGYWSGIYCGYYFEKGWSDSALSVDSYEGDIVIYGWSGNYWYNQSTRQVVATPERTQYRYRDRIK